MLDEDLMSCPEVGYNLERIFQIQLKFYLGLMLGDIYPIWVHNNNQKKKKNLLQQWYIISWSEDNQSQSEDK